MMGSGHRSSSSQLVRSYAVAKRLPRAHGHRGQIPCAEWKASGRIELTRYDGDGDECRAHKGMTDNSKHVIEFSREAKFSGNSCRVPPPAGNFCSV
jgi:hypothetical protein